MRNKKLRTYGLLMAIPVAALIVTSCSSSNKSTNPPPPPIIHSAHFHAVAIQNLAFSPAALSIPAGDTVQWTNNDSVTHTVTSDTGSELGSSLSPGSSYMHIFSAAGSFAYHCTIHTFMHGSVTAQ